MNEKQRADGRHLYTEFSERMSSLKDEGMVDFKMKVFSGRDTSVDGVVLTLNNVLRLRSEGKLIKAKIS